MDPLSSEYDIIFAGGGTTACVVAGRLGAADSTLRILIVENGPLTTENRTNVQPARYLELMRNPIAAKFTEHTTNPGANLEGRSPSAYHANCVGGGSSVNAMLYNRAAASDYDDWMRLGNPGWGSANLIPLAKKLETYQAGVADSTHGSSGPIKVSYGGYDTKVGQDFLAVAAAGFSRGRGFTKDLNDFSTCDVYGRLPKYIDAETGRRSDAAHFYVYNQAHNPNLHILDRARVNRVIFDGENRAMGIEYQTGGRDGTMLSARASRLVVISAGSFCSPAILERSGIGARDLLEKLSIPMVVDLPGVGQNYKDHHLGIPPPYLMPDDGVTLNSLAQDQDGVFEAQWLKDGTGLLATNGLDAGIKLRPNAQDLEQLTPVFAQRWEKFFAESPDKAVAFVGAWTAYLGDTSMAPLRKIYSLMYISLYPIATGYVHVRSADLFTPLEIDTALLDREEDLMVLRWAYKWSRELARRMDSYRGEYAPGHPQFLEGSQAMCGDAEGPVETSAPEIQYSEEDDKAIDAFHRATAGLGWHPLGTCAMKPLEQSGVVDPQLNVYGVSNLKVADLSIAPLNVGANTYNTALIIGEKAAVLIGEELGIQDVF
ncbi:GMC oxidoreductase-domain-containing protein [Mycena latifolia]|nr:GMC oxidoreductase-domain-containing protein [Mycena latifolia]